MKNKPSIFWRVKILTRQNFDVNNLTRQYFDASILWH